MNDLNFGSRLWLAFILPFKVLFDGALAARLARAQETLELPAGAPDQPPEPAAVPQEPQQQEPQAEPEAFVEPETDPTPALQLLSILQREGRFIDFLQEDMSGFGDAEIGAAARVVQEGCKRALGQYARIVPLRTESEGAAVTLEPGYDAHENRVTGHVVGQPPYRGTLAHHGWRAEHLELPKLSASYDAHVLAPAEVEL